jgi:F-type H+-transporting ATPase subunit gamma
MANARKLDRRRKSVRNIRKITRTMELIATARFKKAMDRAVAATAYTRRITQLVSDLAGSGMELKHPLLEPRQTVNNATLLILTANRGLCGGYNGGVLRKGVAQFEQLSKDVPQVRLEVSGNRGISSLKYRGISTDQIFTQFDDQPKFEEVEPIANGYLELFSRGELDRLDVAYTRFVSSSKQQAVVETLLPLGALADEEGEEDQDSSSASLYEFVPSAESILEEVVPASFRVKLFKCFLDAAVSEQIARMVAMKSATENASDMIKQLSMSYNRARQSQITNEIMEIIGGVEALSS